ncbi:hypothetical protein V5799_020316 [Amblyomma americanum]|uniref:Secreted protein n=1 Tax=Amblyomma americanum TaxID=6943 RepID=A0AAQ4EUI8_AMBAM
MRNRGGVKEWVGLEGLLALCCCLALLGVTQAQFFSKTTNTIPRMGRRAVDYPQLEEPRLGRMLGLLPGEPVRQPAELSFLLGGEGFQYATRDRPANGCRDSRCRMRGAAFLPALQAIEDA